MRISLLMLAALSFAAPKETKVMEWKAQGDGPAEPGHVLVSAAPRWDAVWKRLNKPAPPVDFSANVAVVVYLGERPTGGWGVEWSSAPRGADLAVRAKVKKPTGMVTMAFTRPWAARAFPKPKGRVLVEVVEPK